MKLNYKSLAVLLFFIAAILRVLLCWSNPPDNYFDNHFEPIVLIMQYNTIPDKDACWQCYHPPVFYWASAMVCNIAMNMGASVSQLMKLLQFICCYYGILTVGIIYLILCKLPLSDFSRLIAFGTVCFLPRHIYLSAIHSNDTISYLFVALSIYLMLIAIERKLSPSILLATSLVISITLFTKYTAYVVLPIVLVVFASLYYKQTVVPRKQVFLSFLSILLIPLTVLSVYWISNMENYGSPLPWNAQFYDPGLVQPRDDSRLDFLSFKPWESISTPIVVPGKMHSFWTLLYNGMWFDNEPRFLRFMDSNTDWWKHYYGWLRGEEGFPGDNPFMSGLTMLSGAGLMVFGLVPLLLMMSGLYHYVRDSWKMGTEANAMETVKMTIFPALLFSNAAGIVAIAMNLQVYSAVKASYFLNSLPAFAVFLALGLMPCEKNEKVKWVIMIVFGALFTLVSFHILHISQSLP
jgi:4-amino-4-deoxy-L-arabinose transferase-like glycosyltransferase